jgi:hypothetical protein
MLQRVAARNIGNRPDTWADAYDLLMRVNERKLVEAIMQALKLKLRELVEESRLLKASKRRRSRRQQVDDDRPPAPSPAAAAQPSPGASPTSPRGWLQRLWGRASQHP